jgi:hypothetical protein
MQGAPKEKKNTMYLGAALDKLFYFICLPFFGAIF